MQRTLKRDEYIPVVQQALADILNTASNTSGELEETQSTTMDDEKPQQVRLESHRGRVAQALSGNGWMDCYDVAAETNLGPNGASSVLSDNRRAGYVRRRESNDGSGPQYEYKLKESVEIVE